MCRVDCADRRRSLLDRGTELLDERMAGPLLGGRDVNLPRTEEFVSNDRGQRLHARTDFPGDRRRCGGVVVYLHGYGAHGSRPAIGSLGRALLDAGYALVALDFHGHGYSDGPHRALVRDCRHLLDDALCLLKALYCHRKTREDGDREGNGSAAKGEFRDYHLKNYASDDLNLYIMGHSMGGGIAILVADLLSRGSRAALRTRYYTKNQELIESLVAPRFSSCLLLCPLVYTKVPTIVLKMLHPLSVLFPMSAVPTWIMDENAMYNEKVWSSRIYRAYIESDGFPANPTGCSYGGNVRFGTMRGIRSVSKHVRRAALGRNKNDGRNGGGVGFPFLLLHDPDDCIVDVRGSLALMDSSAGPPRRQNLVPVPGGLHDLLANKFDFCARQSLEWLNEQQQSNRPKLV